MPGSSRVAPYLIGTYLFSWTVWLGLLAANRAGIVSETSLGSLYALGGVGPSLTALVLAWRESGSGGAAALAKRVLDWRAPLRWYAFALGAPVVLRLLALGLYAALGGTLLPNGISPVAILVAFVIAFVVPLMEEYGWRGHMQPRLARRFPPVLVGLLVGAAWAAWHYPLFWFPGTGFYRWALASGHLLAMAGYTVAVISLAMLFTLQFQRTNGNLLLAFLFHDAVNTSSDALFAPYARAGLVGPTWCAVALMLLAAIVAAWLLRNDRPAAT
jgi:uncharacterized protein